VIRACALVALAGCLGKPSFDCELAPVATTDTVAQIGTLGGVPKGRVACDGGFAVGLTVALTADRDAAHGNEYIVAKVAMLCAPIWQRDDAFVTGATATQLVATGNAALQADQTAACDPGEVVVGIDVHMVEAGGLFNSVAIECAALTTGAHGMPRVVDIPNTGTSMADGHATCGDEVATEMQGWTGNEVDQLQISCSAPGCS
jgi:hypothetical protein